MSFEKPRWAAKTPIATLRLDVYDDAKAKKPSRSIRLGNSVATTIGRKGCDVTISDEKLSRRVCAIVAGTPSGEYGATLVDLSSCGIQWTENFEKATSSLASVWLPVKDNLVLRDGYCLRFGEAEAIYLVHGLDSNASSSKRSQSRSRSRSRSRSTSRERASRQNRRSRSPPPRVSGLGSSASSAAASSSGSGATAASATKKPMFVAAKDSASVLPPSLIGGKEEGSSTGTTERRKTAMEHWTETASQMGASGEKLLRLLGARKAQLTQNSAKTGTGPRAP